MMVKTPNLCIYRLDFDKIAGIDKAAALADHTFEPCGPTVPHRIGFMQAFKPDGYYSVLHDVGFGYFMRLRDQRRILPSYVVAEELQKQIDQREAAEGRKLGKKEKARLKDEVVFSLMPRAFTKTRDYLMLALPEQQLLIVAAPSFTTAEMCLNALRLALCQLPVQRLSFSAPIGEKLATMVERDRIGDRFDFGDRFDITDGESSIKASGLECQNDAVLHGLSWGVLKRAAMKFDGGGPHACEFSVLSDGRIAGFKLAERVINEVQASAEDVDAALESEYFIVAKTLSEMVPRLLSMLGEVRC